MKINLNELQKKIDEILIFINNKINNNSNNIINVGEINDNKIEFENADKSSVQVKNKELNNNKNKVFLPLTLEQNNIIYIQKKIASAIKNHIPIKLLKEIHKDEEVAFEMCLLFAMLLTRTFFQIINNSNSKGWKSLNSIYLREFFTTSSDAYKKIIKVLEYKLDKGPIVECDHRYLSGFENKHYRLTDNYICKGIVPYELKTKQAIKMYDRYKQKRYNKANENIICKNLLKTYQFLEFPTLKEIEAEADRLIANKAKNKKNKIYRRVNKHKIDTDEFCYIEDSISIFKRLTENELMTPSPSSIDNGYRIIDCITLMPSWIRRLIKINSETLIEIDFVCFHPNIAISLYNGRSRYLTHADLGLALGIPNEKVKEKHLSFFNLNVNQMIHSELYSYYRDNEGQLIKNIIDEKLHNKEYLKEEDKHKITSRKMFLKEVEIMTEIVRRLNEMDIYVLYVYDSLLCSKIHQETVQKIMDETVIEFGVYTVAKKSN